jgi:hypothetical protein
MRQIPGMIPGLRTLLRQDVSLRSGALVIAGLLAVAGLGSLAVREARQAQVRSRVRQAMPKVREETARELQTLMRAIEAYKSSLGCYPPDHVISRNPPRVDVVTNALLYELLGTVHDRTNEVFYLEHLPAIRGRLVRRFFDVDSFKNCAERPELVKPFIRMSEIRSTLGVSSKPDVALLAFFPAWEGIEPELTQEIGLASWRYNATAPVHNPGSYDLWIEVPVSGTKVVVGNW